MLLDLLKSQRTSRAIRGWHCCAVPVKFHTEEKILHHTHTNTNTHNECTNASMYLLKQPPITHKRTHTKTTYWKLHSHQGNFNCLELESLNFIIVQNWLVPNAMPIYGKYIPYIYLPHLWHLRDVHPHSKCHFSQAADNKCLDVT